MQAATRPSSEVLVPVALLVELAPSEEHDIQVTALGVHCGRHPICSISGESCLVKAGDSEWTADVVGETRLHRHLETELLDRHYWVTRELASAVFDYIEICYYRRRRPQPFGLPQPGRCESFEVGDDRPVRVGVG